MSDDRSVARRLLDWLADLQASEYLKSRISRGLFAARLFGIIVAAFLAFVFAVPHYLLGVPIHVTVNGGPSHIESEASVAEFLAVGWAVCAFLIALHYVGRRYLKDYLKQYPD